MAEHHPKIVIDLDGVLAGPKPPGGTYADCAPNVPIIVRLRELKALGFIVAVYTSRNVKSFDHNEGKIAAITLPEAAEWLKRHGAPYDELWISKPWAGSVGVYVDDRAVLPHELMNMTSGELLERARSLAFDPDGARWTRGSSQDWSIIDVRQRRELFESLNLVKTIRAEREQGKRTMLIIEPDCSIEPGHDEELRRVGARWARFGPTFNTKAAGAELTRELFGTNEAGLGSAFDVEPNVVEDENLASRYFNHVHIEGERVVKTGADAVKLEQELLWLDKFPALSPSPAKNDGLGYSTALGRGGSLAQVLLRARIDPLEMAALGDRLTSLWNYLRFPPGGSFGKKMIREATDRFDRLTGEKVTQRLNSLTALGIDQAKPWTVNGIKLEALDETCWRLQEQLEPTDASRMGILHGDLCPGNIILMNSIHDDDAPILKLIDPRGDVLYGDLLYDMGKLAHALRWGYDSLVEGWYDCFWTTTAGELDVRLKLWDEELPMLIPNRLRLWDHVAGKIKLGEIELSSKQVHVVAALHLISCASLHAEDERRMIALVARGLQAAQVALGML